MCMRLYLPILCVLMLLAISANVATAAEPDPVGWWKFDDGAGAVALDSSGSGNHGTIFGDPQWIAGQLDGALQLDGTGDYVELPIGPVIGALEEATLMLWVNWSGEGANWQRILDLGSGTANYLYLCPNNGSTSAMRVAITVNNGVWNEFDSSEGLLPLGWHHVTITVSSSAKRMELHLDGESVGSMANITNTVNALGETTQNWIGRSQYDADPYFNGAVDDLRIYNVVLSDRQIQTVMSGLSTGLASGPLPANEATDVPRDVVVGWTAGQFAATHDVYLGTSFADVDAASRGNALGVLVSQGQAGTTYTPPVRLEFETTYYWRIDEVNAAPDNTVFKGEVWSFTTEPFTYPVANIIATSNVPNVEAETGPENTVNGSGLDAAGKHSIQPTDMWLAAGSGEPVWLQCEFDSVYKIHEMRVWNYNVMFELMLGFGFKDTTVEYSTDGETWTALGDFVFARGTAKMGYEANTIVDFQGVAAKYVRLTARSGYGMMGQFGLSEVQFMYIPVVAREPQPESGATDVEIGAVLDWRSGREAASHQVYLGTEEAAVVDGTAPAATVSDSLYDPGVLTMDATYYWRIDEVNEAEAIATWAGPVWSFSTQEFVVVDDFEGYNDDVEAGTAIFDTWLDGWTNGTGSTVGYMNAPFAEQAVIHSGEQSMPLYYEGNSQADFTMAGSQDWTAGGATTLVLYFRGSAENGAGQFYVMINDKKLTYPGGLTSPVWKQWNIDLASVGTNLAKVASFSVGVDGSGSGLLFVDDIRLYREAPEAVAPADPGTTGLAAYYQMEGNVQDSSGNNRNGTAFNDPTYAAAPTGFGQAIQFDGFADYVELPIGSVIASSQSLTISTRVLFAGTGNTWQRIFDFGTGANVYMFLSPNNGATNSPRFAITTSAGAGESAVTASQGLTEGWHHLAVVIDAASMTVTLYVDGEAADSTATTTLPADLGATTQNWLARSQYTADPYFAGSLDEFQIYTRALSVGEVRYLAGDR